MQEVNHSRPLQWPYPLFLLLLCLALQLGGFSHTLRFDRALIDQSHWWLLLSCNFVHLGNNHLFMNMAGLGLIYFLLWSNFNTLEWLIITLFCSVAVGAGLYLWNPELYWYVGFSGTLHGLIMAGALADMRIYAKSSGALLLVVTAKLLWEQVYGAVPGSAEMAGGNVVVDSHLYGAVSGVVAAIAILWIRHLRIHDSDRQSSV